MMLVVSGGEAEVVGSEVGKLSVDGAAGDVDADMVVDGTGGALLLPEDPAELLGVLLPTGQFPRSGAGPGPLVMGLQPGKASMMPRETSSMTDGR